MHDPRTSSALRQLADLGTDTTPSGWRWSIVTVQSIGRIRLPAHAAAALRVATGVSDVRGRVNRVAWLLTTGGPGARVGVDARGRAFLPMWLRTVAGAGRVLVGTRAIDGLVVVASTALLDGLGDRLAAPVR